MPAIGTYPALRSNRSEAAGSVDRIVQSAINQRYRFRFAGGTSRQIDTLEVMDCAPAASPDLAALLRINLTYFWRHGRLPNLADPTRFTELVQLRKLYDRDPRMPIMADKVAMKSVVADRLGHEWVVPMLWSGEQLPSHSFWDQQVIIKSRHGCNQNIVMHPGETDWATVARLTRKWMRTTYGGWLDEWLYQHIPHGLLVEPFIGRARTLPVDYKVFVFEGQATHVQAHLDRASNHRWFVHDTNWQPFLKSAPLIERPSALSEMIAAAEELSRGFSFARVDFYQPGHHPLFGEMTFYPGSGLHLLDPPELDHEMGRLWLGKNNLQPKILPQGEIADIKLAACAEPL